MNSQWLIIICVVTIAIGQVLFKQVAINYNRAGTWHDPGVIGILLVAGFLYLVSTGLWVWALRSVALSRAYPYAALGFVLVPLASMLMFGEVLTLRYAVGVCLIVAGVVMTGAS